MATGFSAPVHRCVDNQGRWYVTAARHTFDVLPRSLTVDMTTGACETVVALPQERWLVTGVLTGACWHQGTLSVTNTDRLVRVAPDGTSDDIVTGLPGRGDP